MSDLDTALDKILGKNRGATVDARVTEAKERVTEPGKPKRQRNYKAMGGEKLLKVIEELRTGGAACSRAADPAADLAVAEGIAKDKGLL